MRVVLGYSMSMKVKDNSISRFYHKSVSGMTAKQYRNNCHVK